MFKKDIKTILENNDGLQQIVNLKNIKENDIEELNKELNNILKTFNIYGINLEIIELLLFNLLMKNKETINNQNLENIDVNGYYKAGNNNYREEIGDLVEVKINEKTFIGLFLGSIPSDYSIIKEENNLKINFENFNGLIYIFETKKLVTTEEVWFKKVSNKQKEFFNNELKKLLINIKNIGTKNDS